MQTVERSPQFLTQWGDPSGSVRRRRANLLSIVLHIAGLGLLLVLPGGLFDPPPMGVGGGRVVTPLIQPPNEIAQAGSTEGKVKKELNAQELLSKGKTATAPPSPVPPARTPKPLAAPPAPKPAPAAAALPEPPRIEVAPGPDPNLQLPLPPGPQIAQSEKPRLTLEDPMAPHLPAPGQARQLPRATAAEALRGVLRGGGVSAPGADTLELTGPQAGGAQLLSDPMGVDFSPYLTRVLAAVKRYWLSVWPESARMGRSGRVAIQFSIDNNGRVPKLVIATPSGVDSLDRAAVAAISGSTPFPPLPREFKGEVIKVQLNFAYNMPKQ